MSKQQRPVIAFVTDAIYPYHYGGKESRYYELTRRLADRADVHVYTMHWWQGPSVCPEGSVSFHSISPLCKMYAKNRRSISQAVVFALSCFRLLASRFDVLETDHVPYLHIFVLRWIATVKRRRFVVTWHEVWGRAYWCQYLGCAGPAAWFVERMAMRLPDRIIAASPQTASRLRAVLGVHASITSAPNGINLEAIRIVRPDHRVSDIIAVGRMIEHKRIDMLLDAVALLYADGIPAVCRIIGDGPERTRLHKQAQALGIEHAVSFHHDVRRQEEIYALLKAAKVFVSPSVREGFGIAVLEAIACGLPVVTTAAPDNLAQHLVSRSSRGIVCGSSTTGIADAVRLLLASPASRNADDTSDQDSWLADYTWEATAARVAQELLS